MARIGRAHGRRHPCCRAFLVWSRERRAVAGLTFLTTRWVYWDWIPVAPTYAALQYVPVIVWLLARPLGTGAACLLGVLLALQCTTDLVYLALPVLATPSLVALSRLARRATRREGRRLVGAIGLAMLLLSPLITAYVDVRAENPNLVHQSQWSSMPRRTTLPDDLVAFLSPTSIAPAAAGLLLLGMAAAVAVGPVRPRAWRQVLLWIAVGTVLSFGSRVVVGGWSLPNHLDRLARMTIPALEAVRRPDRIRATALVGLCLLAGLAFATCVDAIRRRWSSADRVTPLLGVAMAAALYGSARVGWPGVGAGPIPFVRAPPDGGYPLTPAIGSDDPLVIALRRGESPVLELPADSRNVVGHARAMSDGLWHWRPVLNGYGSYWPSGFAFRMALAERLPDPHALAILRDATGVATIVVYTSELSPARREAWNAALATPRDDFASHRRVKPDVIVIDLDDRPAVRPLDSTAP